MGKRVFASWIEDVNRRVANHGGDVLIIHRINQLSRAADFERFQGSRVKLTTKDPVNGNRHFEGRLEHFGGGRLTLDLAEARKKKRPQPDGEQKLEIELANVEKANLVPEI